MSIIDPQTTSEDITNTSEVDADTRETPSDNMERKVIHESVETVVHQYEGPSVKDHAVEALVRGTVYGSIALGVIAAGAVIVKKIWN